MAWEESGIVAKHLWFTYAAAAAQGAKSDFDSQRESWAVLAIKSFYNADTRTSPGSRKNSQELGLGPALFTAPTATYFCSFFVRLAWPTVRILDGPQPSFFVPSCLFFWFIVDSSLLHDERPQHMRTKVASGRSQVHLPCLVTSGTSQGALELGFSAKTWLETSLNWKQNLS